jgi:hypothetical protein
MDEEKPVEKPVAKPKKPKIPKCPYCGSVMRPKYFEGYYDSFPFWECTCIEIPGAEIEKGGYTI